MKYTLTPSSLISSHKTRTFKYKFQLAQHSQVPSLLTPVLPLNHLSCPSCSQPTTSPCRSSTALPSVCTPSSSSIRPRVTTARLNYTTISIRPAKVNKTTTWPPYSTAPPATPTRVSNHILQHHSLQHTLQKHSDPLLPASLPKRPPRLSHLLRLLVISPGRTLLHLPHQVFTLHVKSRLPKTWHATRSSNSQRNLFESNALIVWSELQPSLTRPSRPPLAIGSSLYAILPSCPLEMLSTTYLCPHDLTLRPLNE